jgi:dsRNA-specific ribonuclease
MNFINNENKTDDSCTKTFDLTRLGNIESGKISLNEKMIKELKSDELNSMINQIISLNTNPDKEVEEMYYNYTLHFKNKEKKVNILNLLEEFGSVFDQLFPMNPRKNKKEVIKRFIGTYFHNDSLAFSGDRILDVFACKAILEKFNLVGDCRFTENPTAMLGQLKSNGKWKIFGDRIRLRLPNNEEISFNELTQQIYERSEFWEKNNVRHTGKVNKPLADVFEAWFGVIDWLYGMDKAKETFNKHILPNIDFQELLTEDYNSVLNLILQGIVRQKTELKKYGRNGENVPGTYLPEDINERLLLEINVSASNSKGQHKEITFIINPSLLTKSNRQAIPIRYNNNRPASVKNVFVRENEKFDIRPKSFNQWKSNFGYEQYIDGKPLIEYLSTKNAFVELPDKLKVVPLINTHLDALMNHLAENFDSYKGRNYNKKMEILKKIQSKLRCEILTINDLNQLYEWSNYQSRLKTTNPQDLKNINHGFSNNPNPWNGTGKNDLTVFEFEETGKQKEKSRMSLPPGTYIHTICIERGSKVKKGDILAWVHLPNDLITQTERGINQNEMRKKASKRLLRHISKCGITLNNVKDLTPKRLEYIFKKVNQKSVYTQGKKHTPRLPKGIYNIGQPSYNNYNKRRR